MKKLIIIFTLYCINSYSQKELVIKGSIFDIQDNSTILLKKNNIILDSTYLKNNEFFLNSRLNIEPSDVILVVKNNYKTYEVPLFLGNEKVSITCSINDFPFSIKTNGSKYDNDRFEYMQKIEELYKNEDQLLGEINNYKLNNAYNDSINNIYHSKTIPKGLIIKLHENFQKEITEFIKSKNDSYFALKILNLAKENYSKKELENILNQFNKKLQYNYDYTSLKNFINNYDIEINDRFIDFEALNADGNIVKFSNYFKNDYILLNFSSMYCSWCEDAKPSLQKLKDKLGNKIQIINFYIDEEPLETIKFLSNKNPAWEILWDPERKLPTEYMNYKIQGTPTFYLFNKQGFLIKKIEKETLNIDQQIENIINNQ